jgi:hypothetical protein
MAFVHAKNTHVSLNAVNISTFCNNTDFERESDEHDVTCYGKNSHVFKGGLLGGKCTISGVYDDSATGPRAVIEPLIGTNVALVIRAEGTGSGKPQDTVDVLVKSYKESLPVADMVMWSADLTLSDDVTTIDQA